MRFLKFLKRKKEEIVKPEKPKEEVVEKEFPKITVGEQKKHIGKHVAIVNGKIFVSAATAKRAFSMAKKEYPDKEIEIRFVGSKNLLLKCKCLEKGVGQEKNG